MWVTYSNETVPHVTPLTFLIMYPRSAKEPFSFLTLFFFLFPFQEKRKIFSLCGLQHAIFLMHIVYQSSFFSYVFQSPFKVEVRLIPSRCNDALQHLKPVEEGVLESPGLKVKWCSNGFNICVFKTPVNLYWVHVSVLYEMN